MNRNTTRTRIPKRKSVMDPIGLTVVHQGHDQNGVPTERAFTMYFRVPPMVGDIVQLGSEDLVVVARKWNTRTADLEIYIAPRGEEYR